MGRNWLGNAAIGTAMAMAMLATPARAQDEAAGPLAIDLVYKGDVVGVAAGDARGARYLDLRSAGGAAPPLPACSTIWAGGPTTSPARCRA